MEKAPEIYEETFNMFFFSFLSLVVTKSEHRYNSHNPNFAV